MMELIHWDVFMKNFLFLALILIWCITGIAFAQETQSLKQAEGLSAENGKPILLEFVRTD